MQTVKTKELVPWPNGELAENFQFSTSASGGVFNFHFKWLNDRWNLWVTLPDGEVRQAGVLPGVTSWSESSGYGLVFETSLEQIEFSSLFLTELYILTWL
jgi:hypothetical protein